MPRIAEYKATWGAQPPGPQSEEYAREVAVNRAEQAVRSEGLRRIEVEQERIVSEATRVSQSYADVENACKAITKAIGERMVDVEEVADQLDDLQRVLVKNRAAIGRIDEQQQANDKNAEDALAYGERLYDKYGSIIVHPLDANPPPPFRTDSERSSSPSGADRNEQRSRDLSTRAGKTHKRI